MDQDKEDFTGIAKKLERFLLWVDWDNVLHTFEAEILPYTWSNHYTMQMMIKSNVPKGGSPFKFENMWLKDASLRELVRRWWNEVKIGSHSKMYLFSKKIAHI